jgi:phytoene dehydrogenase-like protein
MLRDHFQLKRERRAQVQGLNARTVSGNSPAAGPKVVIIGAGVAGLSCGCYLQMNGIQTEILESAAIPGGLCTSWHRGPYVFDGCLRWLLGAQPPSAFHQIWTELGAIAGRQVFIHDEVLRIEWPDGQVVAVPADLDDVARVFKRLAPEDGPLIDQLVRDARRCVPLEPPLENPIELLNPLERTKLGLRYLFMVPIMLRYKNVSVAHYVRRFRNPALRETLRILAGHEDMSAIVIVMLLAFRSRRNTGFVAGGSWEFARAITDRYRALGGSLRLNTTVATVTVENRRATGVRGADGSLTPAATVVSCADGHATIFKLLDGKFVNNRVRFLYDHCRPFPAILQISLGIKQLFPGAPHTLNLPVPEGIRVDDRTCHHRMEVELFGPGSGLCPEDSTLMTVRLQTRCEFWTALKQTSGVRYRAEKIRIIAEVVALLEKRFPGLTAQLEHSDIATPVTFIRYTGNWQGSYEGWLPTPGVLGRRIPFTLPHLKNFYMAGHWVVAGGGLPSAALAGRYVAQLICAQFGKKFAPLTP